MKSGPPQKNFKKKKSTPKNLCNLNKVVLLYWTKERTKRTQRIIIIIIMLDRLFAWCGLHRPGKESGGGDDTTNNNTTDRSDADNGGGGGDAASDVGSEASSMISVEEIDPTTGRPHRVLKKKRSLIGRAYRKMTKTRSNNNNNNKSNNKNKNKNEEGALAPAGDSGA